ncbi:hypothetical protein ACFRDV_22215 [Streptomyces fagopyri]
MEQSKSDVMALRVGAGEVVPVSGMVTASGVVRIEDVEDEGP